MLALNLWRVHANFYAWRGACALSADLCRMDVEHVVFDSLRVQKGVAKEIKVNRTVLEQYLQDYKRFYSPKGATK